MTRGQITAGDFILSIAIFITMLIIILPLFNYMSYDRNKAMTLSEIKTKAFFLSDSLIKTTGYPTNWTNESFISIGLANSNEKLNKTKIRNFINLKKEDAKKALGLQTLEFNISFYSDGYYLMTGEAYSPAAYYFISEEKIYHMINNSGLVWDIYSGGMPENTQGAREVYTGDAVDVFNQMISHSSLYRTIIIEESYLDGMDIEGLRSFVESGGILIIEGDGRLISSGFSMSSGTDTKKEGYVVDEEFMGFPYGTNITFQSSSNWYFQSLEGDNKLNIVVADKYDFSRAYIGYWNHKLGKIFYISDIEGIANGKKIMEKINLIGKKAELSTGRMQEKYFVSRPVIFDTEINSLGKISLVIGK